MRFGARNIVREAKAAEPKKLRLLMVNEAKIHFQEKQKIHGKGRNVDVKKPAGATPHGHITFVRFGSESCAKKARKKNLARI